MHSPHIHKKRQTLGEQETELLRFVAARGPVSVGEATEAFGETAGLTRSSVKTMLERLREKNYLARIRREEDGVFVYSSPVEERELMTRLVQRFVERTLAGSLDPFVTYFARNNRTLTEDEMRELQRLVHKLQQGKDDAPR
ncbi:MAG TPA: BlaI/MecI/CopY family transcriptional regulator [Armatimonadaceae bacterium]|jgi:predicted transcriptional regulator|nr:BlaI/MecI/CopY family transcriptional regulator [Armatimonadaceae bacterium]